MRGAAFAPGCAKCGSALPAAARFCPACGQPTAAGVVLTPSPRFASPESYTPRHLAERMLLSRTAAEGERKQVTILFADLKGSMELLADRDPEDARQLLDSVLEHMIEAVHWYEGIVNQVMGDGIMALFGAPLAHEDHAVRACYAALRMQGAVKKYAESVQPSEARPIQIRVGMNSGEVVVRLWRATCAWTTPPSGRRPTSRRAWSRWPEPGSILISPATLRLVEGYVQVTPLGERPVKGLVAPLEMFEVVGADPVRSRFQAAAARGLTTFVGRARELGHLESAIALAGQGHGQVVAILAEAGVGKSRLLWEFLHSPRTQGWLILESGCAAYRKTTAYQAVIELLRMYFQIELGDEAAKIADKVSGRLLSVDPALEAFLPGLLWLLDVPTPDPHWQSLDLAQRRQRTLDAVKRLLLRESQVQPVIVVVEDLHWVDPETRAVLDTLVDSLPTARLLLVVSYRPEHQHAWGGRSYYRHLRVEPLAPENAEELVRELLGDDDALLPLKRQLIASTAGNPFFLEESVRTLRETRVLTGERGDHHLTQDAGSIQIPPTVQAILAARIDRLPQNGKRLLQSAAVIGMDVPFVLLQEIAGESDDELREGLEHLRAAEFLYEAHLFPDLEYTFRHALTQEVAYEQPPPGPPARAPRPDRRGHRAPVRRPSRRAGRAPRPPRLPGRHLGAGGDVFAPGREQGARAVGASGGGGVARAGARGASPSAGDARDGRGGHRHPLRPAHGPVPAGRVRPDLRAPAGRRAPGRRRRRPSPTRLGAPAHGRVLPPAGAICRRQNPHRARPGDGSQGRGPPAPADGDALPRPAWHALGDYRRASDLLRTAIQAARDDATPGEFGRTQSGSRAGFIAVNLAWLARCLAECGEFEEGIAGGQEGLAIAEGLDHPYALAAATLGLGYLYAVKGDAGHAVPLLERSHLVTRDSSLTLLEPQVQRMLGYVYALSGRVGEGVARLEQAVRAVEAKGLSMQHATAVANRGEAYLRADRLDEARAAAERALALARERGQRGDEAFALRLLGAVWARTAPPDPDATETHYRQALTLADELGMRPLVARCHLGLGASFRRFGRRGPAREHVTAALGMFREMGAGFWIERAEEEARQLE